MEQGRWPIRGELVRWAREQQGLSRAVVRERGGPMIDHLTAIELGRKSTVSQQVGTAMVGALNVTEEFVRGEVPRWFDNQAAVAGMAHAVASKVAEQPDQWTEIGSSARVRTVLTMILADCPQLPRAVLAHVLGVCLPTFDDMLLEKHPIMKGHMEGVACLSGLPQDFFKHGHLVWPDAKNLPLS